MTLAMWVHYCITSKRDITRHVHVSGDYAAPPLLISTLITRMPGYCGTPGMLTGTPDTWDSRDTASCLYIEKIKCRSYG